MQPITLQHPMMSYSMRDTKWSLSWLRYNDTHCHASLSSLGYVWPSIITQSVHNAATHTTVTYLSGSVKTSASWSATPRACMTGVYNNQQTVNGPSTELQNWLSDTAASASWSTAVLGTDSPFPASTIPRVRVMFTVRVRVRSGSGLATLEVANPNHTSSYLPTHNKVGHFSEMWHFT